MLQLNKYNKYIFIALLNSIIGLIMLLREIAKDKDKSPEDKTYPEDREEYDEWKKHPSTAPSNTYGNDIEWEREQPGNLGDFESLKTDNPEWRFPNDEARVWQGIEPEMQDNLAMMKGIEIPKVNIALPKNVLIPLGAVLFGIDALGCGLLAWRSHAVNIHKG